MPGSNKDQKAISTDGDGLSIIRPSNTLLLQHKEYAQIKQRSVEMRQLGITL